MTDQILEDSVFDKVGLNITLEQLKKDNKVIGLYFSAHWCPPCRGFTPHLVEFYNTVNESKKTFEVIFVTHDKDQSSWNDYYSQMPWAHMKFYDSERQEQLRGKYCLDGIPTLAIFTSDGNELKLIRDDAYGEVSQKGPPVFEEWCSA